jgi:hypothetical protein
MVEIRVKRAFLVRGARVEPGEVVRVDPAAASELVTQDRAELVGDVPAVSGPLTTESAPSLAKAKRSKGAKT